MTTANALMDDIWKACDLRGIYPGAVSPRLFADIGGAVGTILAPGSRVVIAGDYRLSSQELKRALAGGLTQAGVNVIDAGQGPTPLAYFAAQQLHADAVLMITASHNPASYNGLKLMLGSMPMTPRQMAEIRALTESRAFRIGAGSLESVHLRSLYLKTMLKRWQGLQGQPKPRVVLDAGNGAWSEMAPVLFRDLGFETVCISCTIDGRFPDRSPDCARAENLARLQAEVRKQRNAIGIAWDGDGDRAAFVDENGDYVTHDEVAVLFARTALAQEPHAPGNRKVVVDLKCSDAVRRSVMDAGGEPLIERTGHAFMRGRMVAEDALLGLDACGHYFFRELRGGDDGLFAALYLMSLLLASDSSLCELRTTVPQIHSTPELRIPVTQLLFTDAVTALRSQFPEATATDLDGMRLMLADGMVLIRKSGTEPVLSLRIEGFDRASYDRILQQSVTSLPALAGFLRQEIDPVPAA